ncbi:MAG: hypothetical protein JKY54_12105 [Flavobacteriales bacterium]|nr:hypothetical protein [Flavobacteriales bacterium]
MIKALLIVLGILVATTFHSQTSGTITIEKFDTTKKDTITPPPPSADSRSKLVYLNGLFYSDWVQDEIRTGNSISFKQTRYYFYCTSSGIVYFFRSSGKPKKMAKVFMNDPNKFTEEVGNYELNDGLLYIETSSLSSNQIFRYTGEANSTKMWIGVKAAYHKKVQLNLYLNKYVE